MPVHAETLPMSLDMDLQEAVWEEFELLSNADKVPTSENAVETEIVENFHGRAQAREFEFDAGEPASVAGGENNGPRPLEYFLGGFAFCQQVVLAKHAIAQGVELDDVNISVSGDIDPRGVFGLGDVDPGFDGPLEQETRIESPATPREVRRLVQIAERYCPAHVTVGHPIDRTVYLNGDELEMPE